MPLCIEGLDGGQVCASEMYNPIIRPYPTLYGREKMSIGTVDYLRSAPLVEHIDIVTTLKAMSFTEAEDLFRIQQAFKASLEAIIVKDKFALRVQQLLQPELSCADIPALAGRIRISQSRLIQQIIQRLCPQEDTRFFKRLITFYLTFCECLIQIDVDKSEDPVLELCVRYRGSSTFVRHLGPVLEVSQPPDLLHFDPIAEIQREGQQLRITPHYRRNCSPTSDSFYTNICYTICSDQPWLLWDGTIRGFKGTLPNYSETDDRLGKVHRAGRRGPYPSVNILRVEIKALLTTEGRQPGVRLERTLRARITIKVIPWYANESAHTQGDHHNLSIRPKYVSPQLSPASATFSFGTETGSYSRYHTDDDIEQSPLDILHHEVKRGCYSLDNMGIHEILHADTFHCESVQHYTPKTFGHATPNQRFYKRRAPSSLLPTSPVKRYRDTHSSPTSEDGNSKSISWLEESLSSLSFGSNRETSPVLSANQSLTLRNLLPGGSTQLEKASKTNPYEVSSFVVERSPFLALLEDAQNSFNAVVGEMPTRLAALNGSTQSDTSNERTKFPSSQSNQHSSECESDRLTSRSTSIEFILEDSLVDPEIRRQQALLWKALSPSAGNSSTHEPNLHIQERKDLFDAMKKSAEEEQLRRKERLGLVEVFDEVFLETSSDSESDNSGTKVASVKSSSEQSGHASEGRSDSGSAGQELADSFNHGFLVLI